MRKFISFLICFVVLLTVASCGAMDYIGIDKAKQTVVDDIGAAIDDVKFAFNDLITDENGDYYRLKFSKNGVDYVYEVDAMTGEILNKTSESNTTETMTSTGDNIIDDNGNTTSYSTDNTSSISTTSI